MFHENRSMLRVTELFVSTTNPKLCSCSLNNPFEKITRTVKTFPGRESWKDLGRSHMILEDLAKILFLPRSCHEVAKIFNINISRVKSWQDWLIFLARFQNNLSGYFLQYVAKIYEILS